VLITGCSSGIGRATALRLAAAGWPVWATARRPETLDELAKAGCRTLALDATDEASMAAAVEQVEREAGAVGVLVNNAGYSQQGAIETLPMDRIRRQFETNVFGAVRMAQLALPGMRRQHWGKIVNVGSVGGKLTFPGGGAYHASKYAIEAFSDALRFEVKGFGVNVILIEPGLIITQFAEAVAREFETGDGPYAEFNAAVLKGTTDVYRDRLLRLFGGDGDAVAAVIERAIMTRRPKARYTATPSAKFMLGLRAMLPDRAWDAVMRLQYPQAKD
jgi:NAD(P)-dependent dehydrogenase (short-subunit alcohol dehydrogenase family)